MAMAHLNGLGTGWSLSVIFTPNFSFSLFLSPSWSLRLLQARSEAHIISVCPSVPLPSLHAFLPSPASEESGGTPCCTATPHILYEGQEAYYVACLETVWKGEEEEDGEVRVPEGWQVARRQEAAQGQLGLVHSSSR